MNTNHLSPLQGPPPGEVALAQAPLARVLAQVRFPTVLSIETSLERLAAFQDEVRTDYPVFREDNGQNLRVEIGAAGPIVQTSANKLRRFSDIAAQWSITLAPDAITLETTNYSSRSDFLGRLKVILGAMERAFVPGLAERLGMRYISRIADEGYAQVDHLIRPDMLGVAIPALRESIGHAISEAAMTVAEGDLSLRWGFLPPNGTFDPAVLQPIGQRSWILDIDVSSSGHVSFHAGDLTATFDRLAQRAYAMFRYMVTDKFLLLYGGQL